MTDSTQCVKCKQTALLGGLVLNNKETFCNECFPENIEHKFRATLAKSKQISSGDRLLIPFSGSLFSNVLVHLLSKGVSRNVQRQVSLHVTVVLLHDHLTEIQSLHLGTLSSLLEKLPEAWTVRIHSVTQILWQDNFDSQNLDEAICNDRAEKDQLTKMLSLLSSETLRLDLAYRLRVLALYRLARHSGVGKILFPEHLDFLAQKILSDIALRRGVQIAQDTGTVSFMGEDRMVFLRPFRDFSSKELCVYAKLSGLNEYVLPKSTVWYFEKQNSSIHDITGNFLSGLASQFPATLNNLVKTASKLNSECCADNASDNTQRCCQLCLLNFGLPHSDRCGSRSLCSGCELYFESDSGLSINELPFLK